MGTWGPKLYEDDLAEDIKNEYEELLEKGKNNRDAIEDIYQIYKEEIEDPDEKSVKEIELGENLERWKNEASEEDYIIRKKEIDKLKKKLNSYQECEKNIGTKNKSIKKIANNNILEWKIGDTYAYKIQDSKFEGQYFILRKVQDCMYYNNTRYQSAIIYVQITSNKEIPKNEEEIDKLEYIVMTNKGNVKYQYRTQLYQIPRKMPTQLIYLGNFKNIKTPNDEYIEKEEISVWLTSFKDIEYLIIRMMDLGTNKKPIYKDIDPKNMSDSYIRFLMKVKYYKEKLNIIPPENAIVKDNALLYISLVDSLMIGGFVKNPVGMKVKDMKAEAYNRIEKLEKIVNEQNETQEIKDERINILEDLRKRIENYEGISWGKII